MRVAAVQLTATSDKDANLAHATALVDEAAAAGATLVVLPELFSCCGGAAVLRGGAEPIDGPTGAWAAGEARRHGITLVAGSIVERADDGRLFNTSCVYGPDGERQAAYRKVHLFDVDVPGAVHRESDVVAGGDQLVVTPVDLGEVAPVPLGLSVCYDLRFPELYRILTLGGARVIVVPAAFTAATGPPHWEVLLRARAIENQVVVVAADQCGSSSPSLHWHGHSMVVDAWGTVLARAGDGPGVVVTDVDLDAQDHVRRVLPSLANRRPEAYRWPGVPGSA